MDDLSTLLASALGNPETMNMLKGLTGSLFAAEEEKALVTPVHEHHEHEHHEHEHHGHEYEKPELFEKGFNPDMVGILSKLSPLLGEFNKEDENIRLLRALRPFLKEDMHKKLDEACRIMQIMRLLPLLREKKIL
ncbi:MAG: hypothetical protein LBS74_01230 [Oscillospiraceae bacterium]|jgi:hypothetical protein|nr:hypothetical protein [Oscillospiraceae bacterium]